MRGSIKWHSEILKQALVCIPTPSSTLISIKQSNPALRIAVTVCCFIRSQSVAGFLATSTEHDQLQTARPWQSLLDTRCAGQWAIVGTTVRCDRKCLKMMSPNYGAPQFFPTAITQRRGPVRSPTPGATARSLPPRGVIPFGCNCSGIDAYNDFIFSFLRA